MFFHTLKYSLLVLLRNKNQIIWCFAFPLILGTMFHFAFGGLGADESFSGIPVAVVAETSTADNSSMNPRQLILDMLNSLDEPGENRFLFITYATDQEALALLEEKSIYGIIHVDAPDDISAYTSGKDDARSAAPLRLTISAEMNSDPLYQSILSTFVAQFNTDYHIIADIVKTHPKNLPLVLEQLAVEADYIAEESMGKGSLDESLTYFFNLIAMTCLYGAIAGNQITIHNQANLSSLGARRNISPVHKLSSTLAGLIAALAVEFATLLVALLYYSTVLDVDFGNQIGYMIPAALCGCLVGICLGFFIGSIGRFNQNTKFGILMGVIMLSCFLSGLMVGNMRAIIEDICPLFNRINPAAIIADSFYALVVYPSHGRFFYNIASMLALSAVFCLGGFAMTRRKKYASL